MSKWIAVFGLIGFLAGGCVRMVNLVFKDEQVIADNSLAGTWVCKDKDNAQSTLVVRPAGADKKYAAVFTDPDGKKSNLIGRLGKFGGVEVIELTVDPSDLAAMGDYSKGLLLPLYFPVVIQLTDANHVSAEVIKPDWLDKYLADHPNDLQVVRANQPGNQNQDKVISSSTEDFQKFLQKHLKDDGAMKSSQWERSGPATQPGGAR